VAAAATKAAKMFRVLAPALSARDNGEGAAATLPRCGRLRRYGKPPVAEDPRNVPPLLAAGILAASLCSSPPGIVAAISGAREPDDDGSEARQVGRRVDGGDSSLSVLAGECSTSTRSKLA